MKDLFDGLFSVAIAVTGIAIIAVLVSKQAQTPAVLQAAGSAFSGVIGAAVSPVTGGNGIGYNSGPQFYG